MRLFYYCITLIILLTSTSYSQISNYNKQIEISNNFIEKYKAQDFDGIYAMFDSTMKARIQIPVLKQIHSQVSTQFGEISEVTKQNCISQGEYITCIMLICLHG